jgi:hypothetical protein
MPWLSVLVIIVSLVSGCKGGIQTQWPQRKIFNEFFRTQDVRLGMSRAEVEAIMGAPQVREEGDFRGGHFVLFFYRTHNMDFQGSDTVRGGYTPFIFQNNILVGRGSRAYFNAVDRSSSSRNFTPPPGPPTQGSSRGTGSW